VQQNPRFLSEILASQKLDRGRVVAKSKRLVAVAEEEIKRWGNTAFSLSLPSFFYSKSQFYQALQGSFGRVHQRRGALVDRRGPGVALVPGGKLPWRIFPSVVYIQNALN